MPPDALLRFSGGRRRPSATRRRSGLAFGCAVDGRPRSPGREPGRPPQRPALVRRRLDLAAFAGRTIDVSRSRSAEGRGPAARRDRRAGATSAWCADDRSRASRRGPERAERPRRSSSTRSAPTPRRPTARARARARRSTRSRPAGLVFEQAVAQSSWTLPSVASLLTGPPSAEPRRARPAGGRPQTRRSGAFLADGARHLGRAASARRHHDLRRLGQPARLARHEPGAGLRDLRRAAVGRGGDATGRTRDGGERRLPRLARATPAAPLRRLAPLHGAARSLHAAALRRAAAAGRAPGDRPRLGRATSRERASTGRTRRRSPPDEIAHLRELYDGEIRGVGRRRSRRCSTGSRRSACATRPIVVVTADHGEEFQEHGRLTHGSHLYDETDPRAARHRRARHPGRPARRAGAGHRPLPDPRAPARARAASRASGADLLATGTPPRRRDRDGARHRPDGAPTDLVAAAHAHGGSSIGAPSLARRELYDLATTRRSATTAPRAPRSSPSSAPRSIAGASHRGPPPTRPRAGVGERAARARLRRVAGARLTRRIRPAATACAARIDLLGLRWRRRGARPSDRVVRVSARGFRGAWAPSAPLARIAREVVELHGLGSGAWISFHAGVRRETVSVPGPIP